MNYITDRQIYQMRLYHMYAKSDLGKLACEKFNALQSNIDDHLNKIHVLFWSIATSEPESKLAARHVMSLAKIFIKLSGEYSKRYKEETGYEPGCWNEWENTCEKLRKKIAYLEQEA